MKIITLLKSAFRTLARRLSVHWRGLPYPQPRPEQLTLELDQTVHGQLPLRDAMHVRSAELWLKLGQPELALNELQSIAPNTRQLPWPRQVEQAILNHSNPLPA